MRRSALELFLRRVLLATPLLIAACGDSVCTANGYTVVLPIEQTVSANVDLGTCEVSLPPPCVPPVVECKVLRSDGGYAAELHVPQYQYACNRSCTGRLTEGLTDSTAATGGDVIGEHFARASHLEAAAVVAFGRLASELRAAGAPNHLQEAARRARREEMRHAKMTAKLAARHGATPPPVDSAPLPERPLRDVVLENALEGCVRESFGAAVALFQSRRALDPTIRAMMKRIAREEADHAALAWQIDAWSATVLSADERREITRARAAAVAVMGDEVARESEPPPAALLRDAGLPDPDDTRRLWEIARRTLWSA